jgi:hypothetical protein
LLGLAVDETLVSTMNGPELQKIIATLPSYPEWSERIAELSVASAQDLKAMRRVSVGTALAGANENLIGPHAKLMAEVAEASDLLPLEYRLGTLAVFNNPSLRLLSEDRLIRPSLRLYSETSSHTDSEISSSDFHRPSFHSYTDAVRVSKVLSATAKVANRWRETPIASLCMRELSIHSREAKTSYSFSIIPRADNGLALKEPTVDRRQDLPEIWHNIPQILGREAIYSPGKKKLVQVPGQNSLRILAIDQLLGDSTPGKVLFGKQANMFAARLHSDPYTIGRGARTEQALERAS